jgi:hypothetical protein
MTKTFRELKQDMQTANETFRRDMANNNQQFLDGIRSTKQNTATKKQAASPKPPKKKPWHASQALIVLSLLLFFPLGFYLIWRHSDWSRKARRLTIGLVTAGFVGIMTLAVIFAPPTLAVTSSLSPRADGGYTLTGRIDPGDSVTVNGKAATVTGSTFTINLSLSEGDNDLDIVVQSGSKKTEKHVFVHRFTKQEIAEQQRRIAEQKAREEARKKAEAEKVKQAKIAAAKKKAAAAAAAKKKKAHTALVAQQKAASAAAAAQKRVQQEAAARAAQQQAAQPAASSGSGYVNSSGNYVPSPSSNPSGATAKCRDGTYSYSQHHSGTCSHHGGVAAWL